MKEKYTTPSLEIVEFETEDIITASGDIFEGENGETKSPFSL